MRIGAIDVELIDRPAVSPAFAWRRGLRGSHPARTNAVLRITTEDGAVGEAFHEWSGLMLKDIVDRILRPELVGERADQREWIWHRLWELDRTEEFPIWLIGIVDVALWDLEGRTLGVPVHRLLGTYRDSIPAYASTTTFATVEEFLDVADQCLELGFPAIKLHAWGDAREDADLCQRLREHVGSDIPLMYDGSAGFDLPDAVYLGRALAEADYLWYEEPIREFSVTSYRWLAERCDVPLNVAETSDGAHMNTADFIAAGCAAYVRTSANHRGGITGAMRTAHLADAFRLRAEPHGPTEPAVHLCMAIPNCTYYESLVTSNPVVREPRVGADGLVRAPTEPGIALPDFVHEAREHAGSTRDLAPEMGSNEGRRAKNMKSPINARYWRARSLKARVAVAAIAATSIAGASVLGVSAASAKGKSAPLIVWIDTSRVPYEKAYMAANPHANIKWVLYNGNENGTGVLQSKFALWNRTGWPSNAPDVMFDTQNYDAVQLGSPPYNDLLNLKGVVPSKVLKNFAGTSMSGCTTPSGQIICLRNDSAAEVLWVNPTLYSKFFGSAPVPTTWAAFLADGTALNTAHPGYLIGSVGDGFSVDDYFLWANQCPLDTVTGPGKITIDPGSSNCTAIAGLLDSSGDVGKSLSDNSIFSVDPQKLVMAVGALWEGTAVFQTGTSSGVPNGTMVAYPAPKATNGASVTGDLGGGLWLVSKHAPNKKAAAQFAQYMATSPNIQKVGVDAGLPQYVPDQATYVSSLSTVFGDPSVTEATWKQAAAQVWNGWSPVPWSTDGVWASTDLANVTSGKSVAGELVPYAEALANQARLAGYTVKSSNKTVSSGS